MFYKYPSLVNDYAVDFYSDRRDELVAVSEKIDGSNFSIIVTADEVRYASRNQVTDEYWNGINEVVPSHLIDSLKTLRTIFGAKVVTLYGEIFSSKILKRFNYGSTKIRCFDIAVDGELIPSSQFYFFMEQEGLSDLAVPLLDVMPLNDALKIDVDLLYSDYDYSKVAEGVVLKGWNKVLLDKFHNVSSVKIKSAAYKERKTPKTKETNFIGLSEEQVAVLDYVTESRVKSVESKLGDFSIQKLGNYLAEMFKDVVESYINDNPNKELSVKELKSKRLSSLIKDVVLKTYKLEGKV